MEMLARGLSVRDIEDTFRNDDGSLLLSRTAVSEIGERLWRGLPPTRAGSRERRSVSCARVPGAGPDFWDLETNKAAQRTALTRLRGSPKAYGPITCSLLRTRSLARAIPSR